MNSDQGLVFALGMLLVLLASLEFWRPQMKAVL
jgi:hypothetical protein